MHVRGPASLLLCFVSFCWFLPSLTLPRFVFFAFFQMFICSFPFLLFFISFLALLPGFFAATAQCSWSNVFKPHEVLWGLHRVHGGGSPYLSPSRWRTCQWRNAIIPNNIWWIPTLRIFMLIPPCTFEIVFSSPLILLHRICLCYKILSAPLNQLYNFAAWAWAFTSCHVSFSRWGASFTACLASGKVTSNVFMAAGLLEKLTLSRAYFVESYLVYDESRFVTWPSTDCGRAGLRFSRSRCREWNHRTAMTHYIDKFPVLACW